MRWVVAGIVAMSLGLFMAMWAIQDASLFAAGGFPFNGKWQGWTADFLFVTGLVLFAVALLRSRNK